jgi:hypothetical protein
MGRYDADYGTLLINKGKDSFECENLNGLQIKRTDSSHQKNKHQQTGSICIARNNDSAMVIRFNQSK